jgi:hypothetical protein
VRTRGRGEEVRRGRAARREVGSAEARGSARTDGGWEGGRAARREGGSARARTEQIEITAWSNTLIHAQKHEILVSYNFKLEEKRKEKLRIFF